MVLLQMIELTMAREQSRTMICTCKQSRHPVAVVIEVRTTPPPGRHHSSSGRGTLQGIGVWNWNGSFWEGEPLIVHCMVAPMPTADDNKHTPGLREGHIEQIRSRGRGRGTL